MSDRCFDFDELSAILRAGEGDSRWAHIHACPRCRSRLALYRSYVGLEKVPADPPGDPKEAEAGRELQKILDREILGPSPGEEMKTPASVRSGRFRRLFMSLRRPLRLAPIAGVLALVVAAFLFVRTWQPWTSDRTVFRGTVWDEQLSSEVVVFPLQTLAADGVQLRWRSVPGARTYRVRLLSSRYEELACLDAGRDTVLSVTPEEIHRPPGEPAVSFWLVEALDHGDPIAESAPSILHLGEP